MLPFEDARDIEATVVSPGEGSWFVARADDGALFDVHGVAPGDRVLVRPRPQPPGRAELVALLAPGPGRRTPPCALAARCGGCHWLQLEDAVQRRLRREHLVARLDAAGIPLEGVPVTVVPSPAPLGCRVRVRFQTAFADGARKVGLHRLGEPFTLDVPACPVLAPEAAAVYAWLREELRSLRPDGLTGFELTALPAAPGALLYLNPRDAEPAAWPALGQELLASSGGRLAGIAVRPARHGSAVPDVLGARAVAGRTPGGHPIAAAARGFVQANLAAADRLADHVVAVAAAAPGQRVLELFAGAGLLGWRLAAAGAHVVAVETDPLAEEAARLLPRPATGRLDHRTGDARTAYREALEAGTFDALVVDPPRSGLGSLAAEIAAAGPPRVVFVSCSVRALAHDLPRLRAGGYRLAALAQFDLFPQTRHAETVALLTR